MKKLQKIIGIVSLAGIFAITACTNNSDDKQTRSQSHSSRLIDTAKIKASETKENAAEQLALAAEQMIPSFNGFIYANELLDEALALNPNNTRAIFYKALLKPVLAQKGVLTRVRPWILTQAKEAQESYNKSIAEIPNSETKEFLLNGKEDIGGIADVYKYTDDLSEAFMVSQQAIDSIKRSPMVISIPTKSVDILRKECWVKKISDGNYVIPTCLDARDLTQVRVTRPDYEALSLIFLSYAVTSSWVYSPYSLEGYEKISNAMDREVHKHGKVSHAKVLEILNSEPNFLKLRNPNGLKGIVALGNKGMEAIQYALKKQPELCPNGSDAENNRFGYLFNNGFCVTDAAARSFMETKAILNGPYQVKVTKSTKYGEIKADYITDINLGAFLENPPVDLKTHIPTLNTETDEYQFSDETLGGLFPNGDASFILNFTKKSEDSVDVMPAQSMH